VRSEPAVKPGKSPSISAGSSVNPPKAKKATAIRRVIEDVAKMNLQDNTTDDIAVPSTSAGNNNTYSHSEDYEGGKVLKANAKKAQLEEDVRMVQDLDRWG